MKIGIMSMQRVINYGSYMQALSLKTILEGLGHQVVFVDYKARPSLQHRRSLRYWVKRAVAALRGSWLFRTAANVFRGRPIGFRVPKAYTPEEQAFFAALEALGVDPLRKHYHTEVDALIIGSDEVFNCLQSADSVGYSLELFGKNNHAGKLLSYAASFGNTTLERLKKYGVDKQVGKYLRRFDAISVRDENSAQIVRTLTGKEPYQHVDPALIGGIENLHWEDHKETGYLAVYAYPKRISPSEGHEITAFAKMKGLRVLSLCGAQQLPSFEDLKPCTPYEILPYIKNAEYVVTDTFHGVIFSIINHIPFAVYCRKPGNAPYSNSEKLLDLLKKFDLTDRLITESNSLETIFSKSVDFHALDQLREKKKTDAIEYLKQALTQ